MQRGRITTEKWRILGVTRDHEDRSVASMFAESPFHSSLSYRSIAT
jgi:hypothetical protein